jgi:hypothetical protein
MTNYIFQVIQIANDSNFAEHEVFYAAGKI